MMISTNNAKVYTKRNWTDHARVADGFLSYVPIKQITMLRLLPVEDAPKIMQVVGYTITAQAGNWIAYVAGKTVQARLDDYKARPIEGHIFSESYRAWDEPQYKLTASERHLQQLGCTPYYKVARVWAKKLDTDTWKQSIDSNRASPRPKGMWLCIGEESEPWGITDAWFQTHYLLPGYQTSNAY